MADTPLISQQTSNYGLKQKNNFRFHHWVCREKNYEITNPRNIHE